MNQKRIKVDALRVSFTFRQLASPDDLPVNSDRHGAFSPSFSNRFYACNPAFKLSSGVGLV